MDELRIIKPNTSWASTRTSRISPEDLEWIGASECTIACTGCGEVFCPLYKHWDNEDEPYCAKCLIEDWRKTYPDGS